MPSEPLSIWTVYSMPNGQLTKIMAKRWLVTTVPTATDEVVEADSLEELREKLPAGLYRMPRDPDDDPTIVETWM